jgi:hypothetical protein
MIGYINKRIRALTLIINTLSGIEKENQKKDIFEYISVLSSLFKYLYYKAITIFPDVEGDKVTICMHIHKVFIL